MEMEAKGRAIVQRLVDAGHQAYYAGGWVRDYLLGHTSSDIDIATSASPEEVMALFEKTIPVGIDFGSVVVVEEGTPFEVTSFRSEGRYIDGRRPSTVGPGTLDEDAQRRSITINGMYYDPLKEEVIDLVDGQADLKAGIVRAIGIAYDRIAEDKLRMIRAIRFATRLGFTIEKGTAEAIRAHAQALFPAVSIERVHQEFEKVRGSKAFATFLEELHRFGLLHEIFPSLKGVESIEERVKVIPDFPKDAPLIAYLMELFPEGSLEEALGICDRLKLPNRERKFAEVLLAKPEGPVEWVSYYAHPDAALCLAIAAAKLPAGERQPFLEGHEAEQKRLAAHIERRRTKRPLVTSDHLRAEGVAPGKRMGDLLREAEDLTIRKDLDDPAEVIALLKQSPAWREG